MKFLHSLILTRVYGFRPTRESTQLRWAIQDFGYLPVQAGTRISVQQSLGVRVLRGWNA